MKTTFYIILAFFGLQSNLLFAYSTSAQTIYSEPMEAAFSDNDLVPSSSPALYSLAPVTPREADFSDSDSDDLNSLMMDLAPKTPDEADFLDSNTPTGMGDMNLAPVLPSEATFEDIV